MYKIYLSGNKLLMDRKFICSFFDNRPIISVHVQVNMLVSTSHLVEFEAI